MSTHIRRLSYGGVPPPSGNRNVKQLVWNCPCFLKSHLRLFGTLRRPPRVASWKPLPQTRFTSVDTLTPPPLPPLTSPDSFRAWRRASPRGINPSGSRAEVKLPRRAAARIKIPIFPRLTSSLSVRRMDGCRRGGVSVYPERRRLR